MPDYIPEIRHDDSAVHSLDSLGSSNEHVQSLTSSSSLSFSDQELREEESRQETISFSSSTREEEGGLLGNVGSSSSTREAFPESSSSQRYMHAKGEEARRAYDETKKEIGRGKEKLKKEASKDKEKLKEESKKAEEWADKNKNNPVVVGNAVVITALAGLLGIGAYRMSKSNTLTWNVVGAWAGVVGLFAIGDYYVSS